MLLNTRLSLRGWLRIIWGIPARGCNKTRAAKPQTHHQRARHLSKTQRASWQDPTKLPVPSSRARPQGRAGPPGLRAGEEGGVEAPEPQHTAALPSAQGCSHSPERWAGSELGETRFTLKASKCQWYIDGALTLAVLTDLQPQLRVLLLLLTTFHPCTRGRGCRHRSVLRALILITLHRQAPSHCYTGFIVKVIATDI